MSALLRTLLAIALGTNPFLQLRAQELLWETISTTDQASVFSSRFGDLDGDGADDVLAYYIVNAVGGGPHQILARVMSGSDGTVLDDHVIRQPDFLNGAGDFDLDGHPDYVVCWHDITQHFVEIWSPHLNRQLLLLTNPFGNQFGFDVVADVDLDGDGLPDVAVLSNHPLISHIQTFDHYGFPLGTLLLAPNNMVAWSIERLDDLDGDGCNELVIGGFDYNQSLTRGYLRVLSGRTLATVRTAYDQGPGDLIGFPVALAGDMDRDGFEDYATGNYWGAGARGLLTVYSGATGAILHEWQDFTSPLSSSIVGGLDADLDGVVDIVAGNQATPVGFLREGLVRVFSSRDEQELMHVEPTTQTSSGLYALTMASLGVAPDSPYPVFALSYVTHIGFSRIQVWRCTPPGAGASGLPCSSGAELPTAGVRRVLTPQVERSRIVLGSAPPGAIAWCIAAPASSSSLGGVPLPLALDALGFPGCALQVPPIVSDTRFVGTAGLNRGYAAVDLPFALGEPGFAAAAQWLVLDFATGAFAATPRCEFTVR